MRLVFSRRQDRLTRAFGNSMISILLSAGAVFSTGALAADRDSGARVGQAVPAQKTAISNPSIISGRAVAFGITPSIRSQMPSAMVPPSIKESEEKNENERIKFPIPGLGADKGSGLFTDPLLFPVSPDAPSAMPTPSLTFLGQTAAEACGCLPPDTNGDVGPNHYIQSVNVRVSIYDKTGTRLLGSNLQSNTFFNGLPNGNACRISDDGDPVVLYDPLADRWMISQFEVDDVPGHQCIAISQTPDPLGAWYAYDFVMPNTNFFDYPHYGVWPDGYYLTVNQFDQAGTAFLGGGIFAFDRVKMLAGDASASYIYHNVFNDDPNAGGMLPTDIDGFMPPPAGLPNRVLEFRADEFGDPLDALRTYELVPNYAVPASSTFTIRSDTPVAAFDARSPSGRNVVSQSGGTALDAISDRVMFRVAYRNLGTTAAPQNSWVGNFTVNVSGVNPTSATTYQTGVRWFELRSTDTSSLPTVRDQGTQNTAPGNGATGINNWMGSVAQDNQGNIGLGFSQASTTQRANIMIAGRTGAGTGAGLNEGEAVFFAAPGSQSSSSGRWGDYSSMSVDPVDECTFWYSQEYYATSSSGSWSTRIGKFVFPSCTAPARGTLAADITGCGTGVPVQGADVTLAGGFFRTTDATGHLQSNISLAPGTYSATVSKAGLAPVTDNALVITNGGTTTFTACLVGQPIVNADAPLQITAENGVPPNNAADPDETLTVQLPLINTGLADTTNLVATLQANAGVTNPSGPQNYGVLTAGGSSSSMPFTFTAAGVCGDSITLTLDLQDGANSLPSVNYPMTLGVLNISTLLDEKFDAVSPPALPAGWASSATGAETAWVSTTSIPDSAPNAVFAPNATAVGDSFLVTPDLNVASGGGTLTFRNRYNMESTYDGMVLEININGAGWVDITAGGNNFISGDYSATISTQYNSAIGGRRAWSGLSAGTTAAPAYITSTINLPAAAAGQPIQLRWRASTDSSLAAAGLAGVAVDNIVIDQGAYVCSVVDNDTIFRDGFEVTP
jgi:hypothetical protein